MSYGGCVQARCRLAFSARGCYFVRVTISNRQRNSHVHAYQGLVVFGTASQRERRIEAALTFAQIHARGGSSGSTTGAATDSAQVSGSPTTLKWAKAKSKAMERLVFGGAVCVTCHVVSESGTPDNPEWNVLPVKLSNRFLLKGAFDHGLHKTMECGSCHAAKTSQKATDLLLPGIETCRTCHAGEDSTGKVPSTCVDCHDYHVHGLSPMAGHNGMMQPFGTSPMPATPAAPTAPVVAPTQPAPVQPAPAGGM
mgnify:CR=1 FL=1